MKIQILEMYLWAVNLISYILSFQKIDKNVLCKNIPIQVIFSGLHGRSDLRAIVFVL